MSLLGFDGFDLYNGLTGNIKISDNWPTSLNVTGYSRTTGRFGGGAVSFGGTGGSGSYIRRLNGGSGSETNGVVGCAVNSTGISSTQSVTSGMLGVLEGTTLHLNARITNDGTVRIYRGTTLIATSSVITGLLSSWHFLELAFTIASTGGLATAYVDGTQVCTFTGNTKNGGTGIWDTLSLGHDANATTIYDDVYWKNDTTALGDRRIDVIIPNADTAQKDFGASSGTSNYAMVKEVPNDGDTTYVFARDGSAKDLYDLASLPSSSSVIDGVQVHAVARRVDAGSSEMTLAALLSGTETDDDGHALSTSYVDYAMFMAEKPGGGAWADADISALQIGVSVVNS